MREFLAALDGVRRMEHATDEMEREVIAKQVRSESDARRMFLLTAVADQLEQAADATASRGYPIEIERVDGRPVGDTRPIVGGAVADLLAGRTAGGVPSPSHPTAAQGPFVSPGTYRVTLTAGGATARGTVVVKPDPEMPVTLAQYRAREAFLLDLLRAGIERADLVNTVSPTFAAEPLRPESGMGITQSAGTFASRANCRPISCLTTWTFCPKSVLAGLAK